jgi:hypothetical protein
LRLKAVVTVPFSFSEVITMAESALEIMNVRINEPLSKLRQKFGYDAEYVPFACYDGYQTPAERSGNADVIELEDLLITVAMNSRIGADAAWHFWDGITHASEWALQANTLLRRLPLALDLADATEAQVRDLITLFELLDSVKGIGVAVAGKVLCRKRPRIAPMLDSYVLPIACHLSIESEGVTDFDSMDWAPWYDVSRAIKHLRAMCQSGRSQLDAIVREFAVLPGNPRLAPLRAIESLLWLEATQEPICSVEPLQRLRHIIGWDRGEVRDG